MKGRISAEGCLYIRRVDAEKVTECPFSVQSYECGDWCPRFREPFSRSIDTRVELRICGGETLIFDEFTDER